jgi:heterodisulfide reductase subunit B
MKKRKLRKLLRALGRVDLYAEIEVDSVITINDQAIQMKRIELGKVKRLAKSAADNLHANCKFCNGTGWYKEIVGSSCDVPNVG